MSQKWAITARIDGPGAAGAKAHGLPEFVARNRQNTRTFRKKPDQASQMT